MVSGYQNFQVSLESTLMRGKRYSSKPFRINRIQNILHETFQKVLYGLRKFEILSSKNESGVPLVGVYIYTGEPAGWKRK